MTHAEFNELMGCTTTTEDFDYANFLYMKAGEMTKQEFVKEFKKIGSSPLVKEWREEMSQMSRKNLEDELLIHCLEGKHRTDMLNLLNIMEENPHSYSVDMYNYIIGKVGHKEVICYKISRSIDLNNIDMAYIAKNLQ